MLLAFFSLNICRVKHCTSTIFFVFAGGISFFIASNIAGGVLGIGNEYVEGLYFVTDSSFFRQKVVFPFAAHHREVGFLSGLALSITSSYLIRERKTSVYYLTIILVSLLGIYLSGVRSGLLGSLLAAYLCNYKVLSRKSVVLSVLALAMLLLGQDFISNSAQLLTRSNNIEEIAQLNGRLGIWQRIFEDIGHNPITYLFGYGAFGHITSGLAYEYAWMWPDPEKITTHSIYLQYLVDIGVFGVAIFAYATASAIRTLKLRPDNSSVGILGGLYYILISGFFDVILYYNTYIPMLFYFSCLSLTAHINKDHTQYLYANKKVLVPVFKNTPSI